MSQKSVSRTELAKYLAEALNITQFRDYCQNGLQVERRTEISRLVTMQSWYITATAAAWCTGAVQGLLGDGIAPPAYLSRSPISEPTVHLAPESGVAYLAAGHHATERYGVQALGRHLAEHFGLQHQFIDIDNPV